MELVFRKGEIIFDNKELTLLDRLVIDFVTTLNTKYVLVSGYVAILFGRSRNTEDVDLFIEAQEYDKFHKLYGSITKSGKYYCINALDSHEAYGILTDDKSSVRFAEKGMMEPNFEIKFPQNEFNVYSLEHAINVRLDKKYSIPIGPMELQLAYKLYLGSEKDQMDAAHLYRIFKGHLDMKKLSSFLSRLDINDADVKKIFGETI